nr:hypothetical protein Iba_chr15fCG2860 [Ipomoea batatas]
MIAPTTVKLNQIKGSQSGLIRRRNIITHQVSNGLWFRTIIRQTIPGRRKYCGQEVRRGADKVGFFEMFNQLLSTLDSSPGNYTDLLGSEITIGSYQHTPCMVLKPLPDLCSSSCSSEVHKRISYIVNSLKIHGEIKEIILQVALAAVLVKKCHKAIPPRHIITKAATCFSL